jgi:transposase
MDNARYQRCNKVMDKAKELGIHLLFIEKKDIKEI